MDYIALNRERTKMKRRGFESSLRIPVIYNEESIENIHPDIKELQNTDAIVAQHEN